MGVTLQVPAVNGSAAVKPESKRRGKPVSPMMLALRHFIKTDVVYMGDSRLTKTPKNAEDTRDAFNRWAKDSGKDFQAEKADVNSARQFWKSIDNPTTPEELLAGRCKRILELVKETGSDSEDELFKFREDLRADPLTNSMADLPAAVIGAMFKKIKGRLPKVPARWSLEMVDTLTEAREELDALIRYAEAAALADAS
jgi:hypothetical protein